MDLLLIAIAPVAAILIYIFYRDRYEQEPLKLLGLSFLGGALSVIPILIVESFLSGIGTFFSGILLVFWDSFIVAAATEEFFKLLFLYWIIWKRPQFNEKFDGIVYAVFVSMGFAAIENILYVFDYGFQTGITRAITAVPAHFLFGVTMGFYFGLAKFYPKEQNKLFFAAIIYPILLHGIYDFILMSESPYLLLLFIPFIVFMWYYGIQKIKHLSTLSVFHSDFKYEEEKLKNTRFDH